MSQQIEIAQTLPEGSYKVAMDFFTTKGALWWVSLSLNRFRYLHQERFCSLVSYCPS